MANDDGTYAPKSPDLSFLAGGEEPSPVHLHLQSSSTGYSPFQGQPTPYGQPQPHNTYYLQPDTYNHFSPYATPQTAVRPPSYYPPQQTGYGQQLQQIPQAPYGIPSPHQPLLYYPQVKGYQPPVATSTAPPPLPFENSQLLVAHDPTGTSESSSTMPPRKAAQVSQQAEIAPSPVKTKFPTARIKRIMQADEEVGKVAQQTPIAVGKALELFMVQIVEKSAEVAKDKNSKRITAPMLKQAIDSNPQWDFLQEIVSKVGEEKEGSKAGKAKAETDSDEEAEAAEMKKARGGRKKKAAA